MKYDNLIAACNYCILLCKSAVENCRDCQSQCNNNVCENKNKAENCAVSAQNTVDAFQSCIHECNIALEDKSLNEHEKQVITKCKDTCKDTMDRSEQSIEKILDQDAEGCLWAIDNFNSCIMACDETIETLSKNK